MDEYRNIHKLKCLIREHEVFQKPNSLPIFGSGHSLLFDGNGTGFSYTNSEAYEIPLVNEPNAFLAGSKRFEFTEFEMFSLETGQVNILDELNYQKP